MEVMKMKANIYISLKPKMNENITFDTMMNEYEIEDSYNDHLGFSKNFGLDKVESLEGFKLSYLYLENVEYNGRKKKITHDDICKTLEKQGYVTFTGTTSIFGGFYKPTEKLINQLNNQLEKRKQLINDGKFVNLKEIA